MRKIMWYVSLLLTVLLLFGCQKKAEGIATESLPEGTYAIYYLNSSKTKLVSQPYVAKSTEANELVKELMDQILTVPNELDVQSVLTDKVKKIDFALEDVILYLYFDKSYTSMDSIREIQCRQALAKTLTQIPGVDYISIFCDDQPLLDTQGNPVGTFTASDFVESISDINNFERVELTLYFANETGDQLLEEKREVIHNMNTSMEKLIIEQLIKGPGQEGLYPTLGPEVKLLNISVNDNVCYINFDSSFLNQAMEVKEYIPIYSIVNSISGFSSVNKVQITINGSQNVMFRDVISLASPFERNLDYIGGESY